MLKIYVKYWLKASPVTCWVKQQLQMHHCQFSSSFPYRRSARSTITNRWVYQSDWLWNLIFQIFDSDKIDFKPLQQVKKLFCSKWAIREKNVLLLFGRDGPPTLRDVSKDTLCVQFFSRNFSRLEDNRGLKSDKISYHNVRVIIFISFFIFISSF